MTQVVYERNEIGNLPGKVRTITPPSSLGISLGELHAIEVICSLTSDEEKGSLFSPSPEAREIFFINAKSGGLICDSFFFSDEMDDC